MRLNLNGNLYIELIICYTINIYSWLLEQLYYYLLDSSTTKWKIQYVPKTCTFWLVLHSGKFV